MMKEDTKKNASNLNSIIRIFWLVKTSRAGTSIDVLIIAARLQTNLALCQSTFDLPH
jgi:hypothetical protein